MDRMNIQNTISIVIIVLTLIACITAAYADPTIDVSIIPAETFK